MDNPCINCLTFPICRNQLIAFLQTDVEGGTQAAMHRAYKFTIKRKCDLVMQFMFHEFMSKREKYYNASYMTANILNDTFKILENMHDSYPL